MFKRLDPVRKTRILSVRLSEYLYRHLQRYAERHEMTESAVVRAALEEFLHVDKLAGDMWKADLCTFLHISATKLFYALERARTPLEFFLMLSDWAKGDLQCYAFGDEITLVYTPPESSPVTVSSQAQGYEATVVDLATRLVDELSKAYRLEDDNRVQDANK